MIIRLREDFFLSSDPAIQIFYYWADPATKMN